MKTIIKNNSNKAIMKKRITHYRPQIRSRHPSHNPLRNRLELLPFRSVVRLGSTTTLEDNKLRIECNTVQGVKNSASKLLMKQCFTRVGVQTADWYIHGNGYFWINGGTSHVNLSELPYPIIAKSHYGSRGVGNTKLDNQQQLEAWMRGKNLGEYIFEKFYNYSREYRLHVTKDGCFYTNRKLVKNDAPADTWQRHDDVCVWILESNPSFKKPANWDKIVQDCIKAQQALGLDICAFDVMVQGSKDGVERKDPKWIICESCSAPSFGEGTLQKYLIEIPKVLRSKYGKS